MRDYIGERLRDTESAKDVHIASSKGFVGDYESEVSWTANICTEEHELHKRL
jgi:hypothetical protein